jgi:hypothetical protein
MLSHRLNLSDGLGANQPEPFTVLQAKQIHTYGLGGSLDERCVVCVLHLEQNG